MTDGDVGTPTLGASRGGAERADCLMSWLERTLALLALGAALALGLLRH